jgi:hypothetical protein
VGGERFTARLNSPHPTHPPPGGGRKKNTPLFPLTFATLTPGEGTFLGFFLYLASGLVHTFTKRKGMVLGMAPDFASRLQENRYVE